MTIDAVGGNGRATIRVATVADISEIHRVRLSVHENQLSQPSRVRPHLYEQMLTTRGRGWVAEASGYLRGFAVVDLQDRDVWALFVEPAFEGTGIGGQLQEVMLEWAFGAGAERLSLTTSANTRAERFYTASGWQRVEGTPGEEVRFTLSRDSWIPRSARQAAQGPS